MTMYMFLFNHRNKPIQRLPMERSRSYRKNCSRFFFFFFCSTSSFFRRVANQLVRCITPPTVIIAIIDRFSSAIFKILHKVNSIIPEACNSCLPAHIWHVSLMFYRPAIYYSLLVKSISFYTFKLTVKFTLSKLTASLAILSAFSVPCTQHVFEPTENVQKLPYTRLKSFLLKVIRRNMRWLLITMSHYYEKLLFLPVSAVV